MNVGDVFITPGRNIMCNDDVVFAERGDILLIVDIAFKTNRHRELDLRVHMLHPYHGLVWDEIIVLKNKSRDEQLLSFICACNLVRA